MQSLLFRNSRVALLFFWVFAVFLDASWGAAAEPSEAMLIVPGKSVGKTHLGPDGAATLKNLPKPNATDPGMSQNRLVWVSGKAPEINTLFIHTVSNGVTDAKPVDGVTIDEIRITSTQFHTTEGITCRSTLAEIRKAYPEIQPLPDTPGNIYQDAVRGIAFEFEDTAKDDSPCIAITVFPSSAPRTSTRDQIAGLLKDRG